MVQSAYGRPPVLDRLITIEGEPVWAARRDLTVRDVVRAGVVFEQVALSYSRFIVRAGIVLTLGNDFVDDTGNNRRIEGVSAVGRGQFIEILGRTLSVTPVDPMEPPVDPMEPVEPGSSTSYRYEERPVSGQPYIGSYRMFETGGTTKLYVHSTDSDGKTFPGFEVGQVLLLTFTNGHTADVTVAVVQDWGGFGGQYGGPGCTIDPQVDVADIGDTSVGLTITIPN